MGVNGQHHAPAALYPRGKDPRYPLDRTLGGPQPVWPQRLDENSSVSVGDRTPVVQSVVRHYTDLATPAHNLLGGNINIVKRNTDAPSRAVKKLV
jgi:hypothetical protein